MGWGNVYYDFFIREEKEAKGARTHDLTVTVTQLYILQVQRAGRVGYRGTRLGCVRASSNRQVRYRARPNAFYSYSILITRSNKM